LLGNHHEERTTTKMALAEYLLEELYKAYIDCTEPYVIIWGMEYAPSEVLKEVDPIAYRVGFSDFTASVECSYCSKVYDDCTCKEV